MKTKKILKQIKHRPINIEDYLYFFKGDEISKDMGALMISSLINKYTTLDELVEMRIRIVETIKQRLSINFGSQTTNLLKKIDKNISKYSYANKINSLVKYNHKYNSNKTLYDLKLDLKIRFLDEYWNYDERFNTNNYFKNKIKIKNIICQKKK